MKLWIDNEQAAPSDVDEQLWAVSNDWEKFPELYMEM